MINFIATDKQTQKSYYKNYTIREADRTLVNKLHEKDEQFERAQRTAMLPGWLIIICAISFFIGGIGLAICLEILEDVDLQIILPYLIASACLTAVGVCLFIVQAVKTRRFLNSSACADMTAECEKCRKHCFEDLHVPEDAETVNLLVCEKPKKRPAFTLYKMTVFGENGNLCICDSESVAAVPLNAIIAIYKVSRRAYISISYEYDKNLIRTMGLKNAKNGYRAPHYYSVQFNLTGTDYEIDVPPGEIEKITKFTKANIIE